MCKHKQPSEGRSGQANADEALQEAEAAEKAECANSTAQKGGIKRVESQAVGVLEGLLSYTLFPGANAEAFPVKDSFNAFC